MKTEIVGIFVLVAIFSIFGSGCIEEQTSVTDRYNEGYKDAKSTYLNSGYDTGYHDGQTAGYNEGYSTGYATGHTEGWNEMVEKYNKDMDERTDKWNQIVEQRDEQWKEVCIEYYNAGWNDGTYKTITDLADIARVVTFI